MLPHADGEDRLVRCSQCAYAANAERAEFRLPEVDTEPAREVEPVETPGCATIADVAQFVGVPTRRTLKVVFYAWERSLKPPEPLMVLLRGDLEVNETKLMNLLGGGELRAATADEIRSVGGEPGYASPVGLTVRRSMDGVGEGVLVIADRSIQAGADFVAGANREGYHLTGVNYGRDFEVTVLTDIAQAQDGHLCPQCEGEMAMESAIELGHCFKLGTRYSEGLGVTYLDADGEEHPVVMGSYGIGVGRLLATIIEGHHDEYGIIWPPALAPFDVHLVSLARSEEEQAVADTVYDELQSAGLTVLYDDRDERAGVKFTDADLVGCPARVTVSRRSLEAGGVELKARWAKERDVVPVDQLISAVEEVLA
jgi:prolyl-tRNA synthetase